MDSTQSVYIPAVDGKDLLLGQAAPGGYSLRDREGELRLHRFAGALDYSLDLIKLRQVYEKVYRRQDFSFAAGDKQYSSRVVSVSFRYAVRLFNRAGRDLYVRHGTAPSGVELTDGVCMRDGRLLAIQVNRPVARPLDPEALEGCFLFRDGAYHPGPAIPILLSLADIRERLYREGFTIDGVHYVRYKRSAGSSRVGKCLFIDKKLYRQMHMWEMCGLRLRQGQRTDLSALEPYIALTLSSMIDTLEIRPEQILVIPDHTSVFREEATATRLVEGRLRTSLEQVEIRNSIFDGQSLLDTTLFGRYRQYGMLLLRGRFFKSCCFHTDIQGWFRHRGITRVDQLNGLTRAQRVEDIRLITTPSSIKYLKFGPLDDWLDRLDGPFGVVKHEKPTHFFDGRMVQCHYQLLNTLGLSRREVHDLLRPSMDYLVKLKRDPAVLRYHAGCLAAGEEDAPLTDKQALIYRLLGQNGDFTRTRLYHNFREETIRAYRRNLRRGHVLIRGNYSTLFGNPMEMLRQAVGQFDGGTSLPPGTVYCRGFADGAELLGSRSPHVTMGNILLTRNRRCRDIDRFFRLSREIVCVNSIGENLLERLSGADFDSDTVLLTDNPILIRGARRHYGMFPVPTRLVEAPVRPRRYTPQEKADLDNRTAVNRIGEIINLAQELGSKLWDRLAGGETVEDVMPLYCDIATLDVLSNLEIDSAKRENPADSAGEIKRIRAKYAERDGDGRYIRPLFFRHLDRDKGYLDEEKKAYRPHRTTMDYLQKEISANRLPRVEAGALPFSALLVPARQLTGQVKYDQAVKILNLVRGTRQHISRLWQREDGLTGGEKYRLAAERRDACAREIAAMRMSPRTMHYLLGVIEREEYADITRLLTQILLGAPGGGFWPLIRRTEGVETLAECPGGPVRLFGFTYARRDLSETA